MGIMVGGFGGLQELRGMNKPVIAVNGIAQAVELALSADIILSADHATFAYLKFTTVADALCEIAKRIPIISRWNYCRQGAGLMQKRPRGGVSSTTSILPRSDGSRRKLAELLAWSAPGLWRSRIVREAEDMKFQDAMNKSPSPSLKL